MPGPLGAAAGSSGPPAAQGNGLPQVHQSAVQTYTCQADDTSYTAISRKLYNDEKYGTALAEFNAQFQDKPLPLPGHKVHVPTIAFLEQHFASSIGTRPPLGALPPPPVEPKNVVAGGFPPRAPEKPVTPDYTPPLGGTPTPIPLENFGPGRPAPTPAPPGQANGKQPNPADGAKIYHVAQAGELMPEIARKTLGDSRRWPEIYRLNGTIDPSYPVPGGTDLRLPSSAVVPRP